jgi:hypothetical protein
MTKAEFADLLSRAYDFPDDYDFTLDTADELLEELKEEEGVDYLPLEPIFELFFAQASDEDREILWEFINDHFVLRSEGEEEE